MAKKPDNSELIGRRFDKIEVISRTTDKIRPNGKKRPVYVCKCDCGNIVNVESQTLRAGKKDCGCGSKDRLKETHKRKGVISVKAFDAHSSYYHMLGRCYNPEEAGYDNYGGRGITVCDRWRESFWNFIEDMGERPENFVLDRIDPDKNYCPENCRWVDKINSAYNTRRHSTNTSGRTGVYWFKRVEKWVAAIFINGKQRHLGYFNTFDEAVTAREKAELEVYGEIKVGERN